MDIRGLSCKEGSETLTSATPGRAVGTSVAGALLRCLEVHLFPRPSPFQSCSQSSCVVDWRADPNRIWRKPRRTVQSQFVRKSGGLVGYVVRQFQLYCCSYDDDVCLKNLVSSENRNSPATTLMGPRPPSSHLPPYLESNVEGHDNRDPFEFSSGSFQPHQPFH